MSATTTFEGCTPCCGGGGVATDCCPDDAIPTTLYATFTGVITLAGPAAMTWDPVHLYWEGVSTGCADVTHFRLHCDAGVWVFDFLEGVSGFTLTGDSCAPFQASGSFFGLFAAVPGCSAGSWTVTITE